MAQGKQEVETTDNGRMVEMINRDDRIKSFEWHEYDGVKKDRDGNEYKRIARSGSVTIGANCDRDLKKFDDKFPNPRIRIPLRVWEAIKKSNPGAEAQRKAGQFDVVPV